MINYIDAQIVVMRKSNSYIRTILDYVISQQPLLDEQVCLARVLSVLDKHNLAVSKTEVRTAFNRYYNFDYHGDKQSYLAWMYKSFHVKEGTLVNGSNVRSQPSKKRHISRTRSNILSVNSHDLKLNRELPHNTSLDEKNAVDYHKTHFGGNLK